MNAFRRFRRTLLSASAVAMSLAATAQCTNEIWSGWTIIPDAGGAVTTMNTCEIEYDYTQVTGIVAGTAYMFTIDSENYITIHQDTYNGPVLGAGYSPVLVVAATNGDMFAHFTVNELCVTSTMFCQVSTVQWFQNCIPPQATFTTVNDCSNGTFTVVVDLLTTGDASTANIQYALDGIPWGELPGSVPGQYILGPFGLGQIVDLTIAHESDFTCNMFYLGITNLPCAIQSCGPDSYTHCYDNNEDWVQVLQGTSTYPLLLQFLAGSIYQWDGDILEIHDGLSLSDPLLFSGTGNFGDLTGINVQSTNPDHALTLHMVSTPFTSCGDGSAFLWEYTVGCLDCTPPSATYTINTDCDNQVWSVDVNITDLGTDPEVEITNTSGVPSTFVTSPGTYNIGPLTVGQASAIAVVNDANSLCTVNFGSLIHTQCPIVGCGPYNIEFCYPDNMDTTILFQGNSTYALAILFNSGTVESCCDFFTIYDGPDATYPILYTGNGNFGDMTGVFAATTNPDHYLFFTFHSDGSVNCQNNNWPPINFTVSCLDCSAPSATFDVVLDCANDQFYVEVDINTMGSDPATDITNNGGAPPVLASDTGVYQIGPFPDGTNVQVQLVNDLNPLCNVTSPNLVNPPCPVISCGPNQYIYCYPDNWDSTIVYQSTNTYPIALQFNAGLFEWCCDRVTIHDGNDDLAPIIYDDNNAGLDMGTVPAFISTNVDNALYVHFHSDGSVNCQNQQWTPLNWTVSCLDCTNPVGTFELVPDCQSNGYNVAVNITSTGTAPTVDLVNSYTGDTLFNVGVGTTLFGPTPVDQFTTISVLNSQNPLCHITSQEFFYPSDSCINVACDPQAWDYCYENSDTAWFVFTSGTTEQITLHFDYGQLLVNDYIQVYNGLDTTAQIIYMGNQGGNLSGFEINSSNVDHALTLLVISSAAGSCATGQAGYMWFSVGCGMVGVDEMADQPLSLYPNPTGGDLFLSLPANLSGRVRVDLMDMTGRLVYQTGLRTNGASVNTLDLSGLATGTYTLVVTTDDQVKTSPVQITR